MVRLRTFIGRRGLKQVLDLACRLVLGVVFFYGGITKIGKAEGFAEIIGAYGLLPDVMVYPVALFLPPLELLVAVALIFKVRGALSIVSGLMAMFIGALVYGIWLGLDIDCGCFEVGGLEHQAYAGLKGALLRDLLLLLPLGFCWVHNRVERENDLLGKEKSKKIYIGRNLNIKEE